MKTREDLVKRIRECCDAMGEGHGSFLMRVLLDDGVELERSSGLDFDEILRVVHSCAEHFTPACSAAALHRLATHRGPSVLRLAKTTIQPCDARNRNARAGEKDLDSEVAASMFATLETLILRHSPNLGCMEVSNVVWAYGALGTFFGFGPCSNIARTRPLVPPVFLRVNGLVQFKVCRRGRVVFA